MLVCCKLARIQMPSQLIRNLSSAQLPRLPVPALQETLNKFLRTVQPLVTEEQRRQTEALVKKFAEPDGVGSQLQTLLLQKAQQKDN